MNGYERADRAIIVGQEPDDNPIPDYTAYERCVAYLHSNLACLFADRGDVTVAANCPWYPRPDVEICVAPSVAVIFGRPKRARDAYRQWEEGDVPMHVVFEVIPPDMLYREQGKRFLF
ncbi:MAG: Uma2 family endonuclease, partial [Gemmataceae bacterium]